MKYFDKHGTEIEAGMTIRHDSGDTEKVYATVNSCGDDDLGVMATNPVWLERHPDWDIEYYPLNQFNMSEWEIVLKEK